MDVKQEVMEKVEVKDEEFPQDHLDQPSKRKNIDDTEPIKQEDGGDDNFDLMTGTMNKRMRNGFKKLCSAIDGKDVFRSFKKSADTIYQSHKQTELNTLL
eukprot:TCONS_00036738-protein